MTDGSSVVRAHAYPAGQAVHAVEETREYEPAVHTVGTDVAAIGHEEPAGHGRQEAAPEDPVYEPAGQAVADCDPDGQK